MDWNHTWQKCSLQGPYQVLLLFVPTKNEGVPPLFTGKLLIKSQNILRNTTQVIIRHRVSKIIFIFIGILDILPLTLLRDIVRINLKTLILENIAQFDVTL
jgi:hypothetical protein